MLDREEFFKRILVHGFGNLQDFNRYLALAISTGFTDLAGLQMVVDEFVKKQQVELINLEKREERKFLTPETRALEKKAKRASRNMRSDRERELRQAKEVVSLRKKGLVCPECGYKGLSAAKGVAELVIGCPKCRWSAYWEGYTGSLDINKVSNAGDLP